MSDQYLRVHRGASISLLSRVKTVGCKAGRWLNSTEVPYGFRQLLGSPERAMAQRYERASSISRRIPNRFARCFE